MSIAAAGDKGAEKLREDFFSPLLLLGVGGCSVHLHRAESLRGALGHEVSAAKFSAPILVEGGRVITLGGLVLGPRFACSELTDSRPQNALSSKEQRYGCYMRYRLDL